MQQGDVHGGWSADEALPDKVQSGGEKRLAVILLAADNPVPLQVTVPQPDQFLGGVSDRCFRANGNPPVKPFLCDLCDIGPVDGNDGKVRPERNVIRMPKRFKPGLRMHEAGFFL